MSHRIRRVAVLGAGVMGSGIAAHLANAGIPTYLFDMVPRDAGEDPKARSAYAIKGVQTAVKIKPAALFRKDDAALITPCNYDDHGDKLAECDWIVEVVVERLDIKQKVFQWVADNRKEGSIVSSNTSGIKLVDMTEKMSDEMTKNFLVTHFFNPVRYMRLLEIVTGPETDPEVAATMATFCDRVLGKGVVFGKDTPNFIANRIGTYGMASTFKHALAAGMTVETVDAIFGPSMGRPSSAVFRTADIVGLDTLQHVFSNLHEYLVDDDERDIFELPNAVAKLIEDGRTGQKTGAGFYKKVKGKGGKSEILALDLETLEYRPKEKPRFPCTGKARKAEKIADKLQAMVYGDDEAAKLAWTVTADTLIYSAKRVPEIADDVVAVDNALKWGFGWGTGPFETWDAIGVAKSVEKMKAEGREVPSWVTDMLATGRESFYQRGDDGVVSFWNRDGGSKPVDVPAGVLFLQDKVSAGKVVDRNPSSSLIDLGDGVLGLEFHSKMNALDELIIAQYADALDRLDNDEFDALVIANQDPKAFCAGANVLMILMQAMQGQWTEMEAGINTLQQLLMRAKYHRKPVVAAPHGLTLGGGVEVSMHTAATQAGSELYMGLVEVGVGLIPGAGGCKETIVRYLGDVPQNIDYDPNPYVMKAFEHIGMAGVSKSAEEARLMGYLRPTDRLTLNPDRLVADAKQLALGLVAGGYKAPRQRTVKLPGSTGRAAIELFLYQMHEGGFATDHDVTVGKKLAHVLTGGDIPWGTSLTEQDLLDLERETFLSLAGTPESQARMQHMLQTGKPLRN